MRYVSPLKEHIKAQLERLEQNGRSERHDRLERPGTSPRPVLAPIDIHTPIDYLSSQRDQPQIKVLQSFRNDSPYQKEHPQQLKQFADQMKLLMGKTSLRECLDEANRLKRKQLKRKHNKAVLRLAGQLPRSPARLLSPFYHL